MYICKSPSLFQLTAVRQNKLHCHVTGEAATRGCGVAVPGCDGGDSQCYGPQAATREGVRSAVAVVAAHAGRTGILNVLSFVNGKWATMKRKWKQREWKGGCNSWNGAHFNYSRVVWTVKGFYSAGKCVVGGIGRRLFVVGKNNNNIQSTF